MGLSTHYVETRKQRQELLKSVGLGTIVHRCIQYDYKRKKQFIYEISSTAILTVRAYDEPTLIITRYQAMPRKILRYWADAPKEILRQASFYERLNLRY